MRVVPVEEAYRDWAATFDHSGSPILALESRFLEPMLGAVGGLRVVDVGCGTGRWLQWLLERGAAAIGLDASPRMLEIAVGKRGVAGRIVQGSAWTPAIADSSADLVLCCLTLGHVQPVAHAMRRLAEIARPGGRVIVTDFHPDALRRGWKRTFQLDGETIEIDCAPYSLDQLQAPGLRLERFEEPCFGEPERGLFESAGKAASFGPACAHPAIYLASFRRSAP